MAAPEDPGGQQQERDAQVVGVIHGIALAGLGLAGVVALGSASLGGGGHDYIDRPLGTLLAFVLPPALPAIVAVISVRTRRTRYATGLFIIAAVVSALETACAMSMYK